MVKIINLLPKTRQQEIRYIAMLRSVWIIFGLSFISFVLVFAAQAAARVYLETQAGDIERQIADLKLQATNTEKTKVKDQVKAANDLVSDFKNLADSAPKWTKVIKAFVVLPPEGMKVNSFVIDPQTKKITITGQSPTRELVQQLYDNILADKKDFYNVDFPFENVAKPKDVSYHFTFYIQDELLK